MIFLSSTVMEIKFSKKKLFSKGTHPVEAPKKKKPPLPVFDSCWPNIHRTNLREYTVYFIKNILLKKKSLRVQFPPSKLGVAVGGH